MGKGLHREPVRLDHGINSGGSENRLFWLREPFSWLRESVLLTHRIISGSGNGICWLKELVLMDHGNSPDGLGNQFCYLREPIQSAQETASVGSGNSFLLAQEPGSVDSGHRFCWLREEYWIRESFLIDPLLLVQIVHWKRTDIVTQECCEIILLSGSGVGRMWVRYSFQDFLCGFSNCLVRY